MPDVFVYAGYLAALTKRIKIGTAVVTLPLANPLRVAENAAFIDILSDGRFVARARLRLPQIRVRRLRRRFRRPPRHPGGSAAAADASSSGDKRIAHHGKHFRFQVDGAYELFPHSVQQPHPPVFLAGATERSIAVAGRMGFGLMLSSWTPFAGLPGRPKYRAPSKKPRRRCATIRHAAMSTSHGSSMSPRPTPRRGARANPASCATSRIFERPHLGLSRHRPGKTSATMSTRTRHHPARFARDGRR